MNIVDAILAYTGQDFLGDSVILQDNGDGNTQIVQWNYMEKPQPTMEELETLYMSIQPQAQFALFREAATNAQLDFQKSPYTFENGAILDLTDDTRTLIEGAISDLKNSGYTTIKFIDYKGVSMDNVNLEMIQPMYSEFLARRHELHMQEMNMLESALKGQIVDIKYTISKG